MTVRNLPNERELFGFIPGSHLLSFSLVTMLFLIWGIPNNMNDILIKQFMKSFELNRFQAGLVQSAFYMAYFLLAVPSGILMKRTSYKVGLVFGLFLFAGGCFLFWPAAIAGKYGLFLGALFVIASGLTFLETGANIFIVEIGAERTAERRLNFSQAFNPIGAVLGVLIGTMFILSGIENNPAKVQAMKDAGTYAPYLHAETMRVVRPYLVLAGFAFLWGILLIACKFPKARDEEAEARTSPSATGATGGGSRALPHQRHFWTGVVAQFFYVGAQVCTWSYFIQYAQDYTGMPEKTAGYLLTGSLVGFGLGRFSATWLMRWVRPSSLMGLYCCINLGLVGFSMAFPGLAGVWTLLLTSFFMSLMYPTIFALALRELGPQVKIGGSIVVMGIVGGAVFPPLTGLISQQTHSMAAALIVPLVAYAYIGWYSFRGAKLPGR